MYTCTQAQLMQSEGKSKILKAAHCGFHLSLYSFYYIILSRFVKRNFFPVAVKFLSCTNRNLNSL